MGAKSSALAREMSSAFALGQQDEGNRILARLMEMQDVSSPDQSGHRGNFPMDEDDGGPTDLNALSFCGPHIAYVALEHEARVPAELLRRLRGRTLPECLRGYDGHYLVKSGEQLNGWPTPRWWQCNIWSLNIAGRLMAARALGDEGHKEKARRQMADYRRFVEAYGIAEFNSPTYLTVQLEGLHWAWRYAPDDAFREDARLLLDETYLDMAEHYHAASGVLGGTWSRHYERDFRGRGSYACFVGAAFEGREPSLLERLGLEDYRCPEGVRQIALAREPYSVWRRSVADARRTMHQTPEYSLATQSGEYVWKQQDTPLLATYAAEEGDRRVALVRTPYWASDRIAASDYAKPFARWAHQHEHQAILSYFHRDGGNELLFNLATVSELAPQLADADGRPLHAPVCPILPAPPGGDLPHRQPSNPHHRGASPDLAYADPLRREPPGLEVRGPILVGFPSCFMALLPEEGLRLRLAVMRGDLCAVVPARPTALLAIAMAGRSQCPSMADFAQWIGQARFGKAAQPNLGQALLLEGLGPKLTAGLDDGGRLFDRRVDGAHPVGASCLCHSPFYSRKAGEELGAARLAGAGANRPDALAGGAL